MHASCDPPELTAEMLEEDLPLPPPDPRLDFERGMSRLPRFSIAVIAACTAVFVWELATGALENEAGIIAAGALSRALVREGEVWRILSAMFLHGGWDHLAGNCIILFIVGMACEHAFGALRTAVLYFVSGLAGAVLSLAMSPGPSVGASGAIFGIVAAVVLFLYLRQKDFYLRDKRIGFVLLFWAAWQMATGFLTPFIDNYCHIGGFVGGALAALAMRSRVAPPRACRACDLSVSP